MTQQSVPDNAVRNLSTGAPNGSSPPTDTQLPAPPDSPRGEQAGGGPPDDGPIENIGTFYAFRYRNYKYLWVGSAFTSAARWIQNTTMGWVVYDLTGSGSLLGAINGMRTLPTLMFSAVAGVASDRMSRNKIIAFSQLGLFATTFMLAAGLAFHVVDVWHLFLFVFLVTLADTFNMPARQTMVFDVVPRSVIPNAIALNNIAMSVTRAIGPMLGGFLIVLLGPANNFFIQGCLYLCVMTTILAMRLPPRQGGGRHRSFFRDIAEGYRFVAGEPQARLLVIMSIISPALLIPTHQLLPIFTKNVFNTDAGGLGILLSAIGAGGIFGGLLTASLSRVDRRGLMQLIALFVFSLSHTTFAVVAATTGSLWLSAPFMALGGAAESVFNATNGTVLQLMAPDHLRGRMASVLQLGPLVMPLGSYLAGTAADHFGAPPVSMVFSLTAFSIGFSLLLFSPRMRNMRLSSLGQGRSEAVGARAD